MNKMKFYKYFVLVIVLVGLFMLTTAVMADTKPEYILVAPCDGFEPLPGASIFCGELNGAGYRVEVPDNWNGDLFVWAHGLRLYSQYLFVEDPPIRAWLIENGYAWAASSYRANELDVAVGVKDTHLLTEYFNGLVAKPDHVYLSGQSMGGAVTVNAIEQYPNTYDGAMPTCGTLDTYQNLDYTFDYYALSNALAGEEAVFPIPTGYSTTGYPIVKSKLELFPGTYPFTLNAQGQKLKDGLEILGGGERPTYDQAFLLWYGIAAFYDGQLPGNFIIDFGTFGPDDLISVTGANGNFIDNMDTIYQFDTDPALSAEEQTINEIILRVAADPQARKPAGLKNIPTASGKITIPVLSMHQLGDLFVPFSLEQIYAQKVAAHGASGLLVQRAYRDIMHCGFSEEELVTSFVDLVNWVENGVKPAGDNILDPAAVADPDFGCNFTFPDRLYPAPLSIPACP